MIFYYCAMYINNNIYLEYILYILHFNQTSSYLYQRKKNVAIILLCYQYNL